VVWNNKADIVTTKSMTSFGSSGAAIGVLIGDVLPDTIVRLSSSLQTMDRCEDAWEGILTTVLEVNIADMMEIWKTSFQVYAEVEEVQVDDQTMPHVARSGN